MEANIRVLLIEDNIHDARILYENLKNASPEKFEIVHSKTLWEGINNIIQSQFDAIIIDLTLPDSNSINTFFEVKKYSGDTPIIINSGLKDHDLTMEAIRAGAQDYIHKDVYSEGIIYRVIIFAIERKKLILELEKTKNQLLAKTEELKEKNSELYNLNLDKDRLYSIVSYDLLNPFNKLLSSSDLLLESYEDMSEGEKLEAIQNINKYTKNILMLIKNILKWTAFTSGKMSFKPVKLHLNKLLSGSLEIYQHIALEKNIKLSFADISDINIEADKFMIETIIRILIASLINLTEKGGEISVRTLLINNLPCVEIENNGTGIDVEEINSLFRLEEIKTMRGSHIETATGMGLMLCKELIEKNNATIQVKNDSGKGILFSLGFTPV